MTRRNETHYEARRTTAWMSGAWLLVLMMATPLACGTRDYDSDDDGEARASGSTCEGSTACSCTCENDPSGCSAYGAFYNHYITCGDTCASACATECATAEWPTGACQSCIASLPAGAEEFASFWDTCNVDADCAAYSNRLMTCSAGSSGGSTGSGSSGGNEDECDSNSDCGHQEKCVAGRCEHAQCTSDSHCSGCNRCENTFCVPCLMGPYGCTC